MKRPSARADGAGAPSCVACALSLPVRMGYRLGIMCPPSRPVK